MALPPVPRVDRQLGPAVTGDVPMKEDYVFVPNFRSGNTIGRTYEQKPSEAAGRKRSPAFEGRGAADRCERRYIHRRSCQQQPCASSGKETHPSARYLGLE